MSFDPSWFVVVPVLVLSLVLHECAHGLAALWSGDPTARDQGRITLNPVPHLHPVGSVLLPLALLALRSPLVFAWAQPVPVDHAKLRDPRRDAVRVALAGPAANLMLALIFAISLRVIPEGGFWAPLRIGAMAGVVWNCALGLFNLIPIPPLDGSWVLMHFLKLRHIIALHHFSLTGLALVTLAMALPPTRLLFLAPLSGAVRLCLQLAGVQAEDLR